MFRNIKINVYNIIFKNRIRNIQLNMNIQEMINYRYLDSLDTLKKRHNRIKNKMESYSMKNIYLKYLEESMTR